MAYITHQAPFDFASFAARVARGLRSGRKLQGEQTHFDARVSEDERVARELDKIMMQAICARGFA